MHYKPMFGLVGENAFFDELSHFDLCEFAFGKSLFERFMNLMVEQGLSVKVPQI